MQSRISIYKFTIYKFTDYKTGLASATGFLNSKFVNRKLNLTLSS